ncbi:MAG: M64 family metallopeptidase [Nanoarchaeota archaeon]|nr:M64 family metallopeptidase [Nanoarchaeota archaeon]
MKKLFLFLIILFSISIVNAQDSCLTPSQESAPILAERIWTIFSQIYENNEEALTASLDSLNRWQPENQDWNSLKPEIEAGLRRKAIEDKNSIETKILEAESLFEQYYFRDSFDIVNQIYEELQPGTELWFRATNLLIENYGILGNSDALENLMEELYQKIDLFQSKGNEITLGDGYYLLYLLHAQKYRNAFDPENGEYKLPDYVKSYEEIVSLFGTTHPGDFMVIKILFNYPPERFLTNEQKQNLVRELESLPIFDNPVLFSEHSFQRRLNFGRVGEYVEYKLTKLKADINPDKAIMLYKEFLSKYSHTIQAWEIGQLLNAELSKNTVFDYYIENKPEQEILRSNHPERFIIWIYKKDHSEIQEQELSNINVDLIIKSLTDNRFDFFMAGNKQITTCGNIPCVAIYRDYSDIIQAIELVKNNEERISGINAIKSFYFKVDFLGKTIVEDEYFLEVIDEEDAAECKLLFGDEDPNDIKFVIFGEKFAEYERYEREINTILSLNGEGYGIFAVEPFKSNLDLFSIYIDTNPHTLSFRNSVGCRLKNPEQDNFEQYNIILSDTTIRSHADITKKEGQYTSYVAITENQLDKVAVHEFGHCFGLADEYTQEPVNQVIAPDKYINCVGGNILSKGESKARAELKWGIWEGFGEGSVKIGFYKGCSEGELAYRPYENSIMNSPFIADPFEFGMLNEACILQRLAIGKENCIDENGDIDIESKFLTMTINRDYKL